VRFCLVTIISAAFFFLVSPVSGDQIIYVNQNAPGGSLENGTSWANAYRFLQDAIDEADPTPSSKVEIWIARGTYKPTHTLDRSASFTMKSHLRLLGGFAGTETNPDTRNIGINPTVLSGDIGILQSVTTRVESAGFYTYDIPFDAGDPGFQDNSYNVVTLFFSYDVVLEGLIIANGNANFDNSSITLIDTNLTSSFIDGMKYPSEVESTNNWGQTLTQLDRRVAGGGIFVMNDYHRDQTNITLVISQCVFLNNAARGYGGGIAAREAQVLLNDCIFRNNFAEKEGGAYWGFNHEGHFLGCDFIRNSAGTAGGAVVLQSLPTDKMYAPVVDAKGFVLPGLDKKVVMTAVKRTSTIINFSMDLANSATIFHKIYNGASKLYSMLPGKTPPSVPAPAAPATPTFSSANMIKGAMAAYALLQVVVSITDLATADMDDTNNADLKRWRIFSDGFNTYATPAGWTYLLVNLISSELGGPTLRDKALVMKSAWLKMYNPSYQVYHPSYSTLRRCNFIENQSGYIGGAMVIVLDNVQVEICRFEDNWSVGPGGAVNSAAWSTPIFMSCVFNGNYSVNSFSAIANSQHSRAQIVNCTITENHSGSTNGVAIANELGSEVKIYNSILWANTSPYMPDGGADILTTRKADLDADALARYNEAGESYGDMIAICDIRNSCVQSLSNLVEGTDDIPLFTENRSYNRFEIAEIQRNLVLSDELGAQEGFGFINLGEGFRPGIKTRKFNTDANPLLIDGVTPSPISPVIDAGSSNLFNNGYNGLRSLTGADININDRIMGRNVDMGAVENPNAAGSGGIIYVKRDIPGGFRDGKTWNTAFLALKDAMDRAIPGSEIWVAAGTYYGGMEGSNPDKHLRMKSGISLYGGFSGTETNRNQRNWRTNSTIISGNVYENLAPDDYLATLFYNDGNRLGYACNSSAILDGFILQDAQDSALYNENASPTIRNCTFRNNRGAFGAGIRNDDHSSPLIENCTFYDNVAIGGGAVFGGDSSPLLLNCLMYNNAAGKGGAVYGLRSRMRIWQSTVVNNRADQNGGGFLSQFGTNEIRNSILWQNKEGQSFASITSAQFSSVASINLITNSTVQGHSPSPGNFPYDPLFEWAATNNYRLTVYSPLLNKGHNSTAAGITNDLDGAGRLFGGTVDIGAYEFQQAASNGLQFIKSPASIQTCAIGASTNLSVHIDSMFGIDVIWEVDTGSGFATVVTGATYSIHTESVSSVLSIHNLATNMNGHKFRFKVDGTSFTSVPVTLSVNPAQVIYVRPTNNNFTQDGITWARAFTNLQYALDAAGECTEIWVAQGTYRPAAGQSFQFKRGVEIYGGFVGDEVSRVGVPWMTNRTILRNNSSSLGVFSTTDPSLQIDSSSVLDGFIIQNTNGASAIRNYQASPTIRNCLFESNSGWAISLHNSASLIVDCIFTNGRSSAINVRSSTPTISGNKFYNNTDVASAGGINSTYGSEFTIANCLFQGNTGSSGGGVQILDESAVTISRSLFRGNRSQNGGAIYAARSQVNLNNLLILENNAFRGGAFAQSSSDVSVNYCSIVRNTSRSEAGGIFTYSGVTRVRNSILWANDDEVAFSTLERAQIDRFAPGTNFVVNSVVQGLSTNFAGNGNLPTDPLFVNYASGNYSLSPFSPSVNAGNAAQSPGISLDYPGSSRVFGAAADMGAYELQSAASLPSLQLLDSPLSSTAYRGAPVFFTVATLNTGLVIKWEVNSGSGFVAITNGGPYSLNTTSNGSTLSISETTTNMNGYLFRYSVTGNSFTSSPINLTVLPAPIIYVRTNAPAGGDGKTWATAFNLLQSALESAPVGAEIWVARGVHRPTMNLYGQVEFGMKPNVGIYGGFVGTETNRSQRNFTSNITTLTSSNSPLIVNSPGKNIDATAILDGFTISNVVSSFAINNNGASPTIRNVSFIGNQRIAIYNQNSSPLIASCTFSNNLDRSIYNTFSSPTIRDSTFANNSASAIYNTDASPIIERCQFIANISDRGGAIANQLNAHPLITHSLFRYNSSGNGGAVYNGFNCSPVIRNSLFEENYTTFRGGAIVQYRGHMTVVNSTFVKNSADVSGAGIYFQQGTGTIHNSIFWNNVVRGTYQPIPLEEQQLDVYQSSATVTYSTVQGLSNFTGNSNIGFEPLFAAPATNDYRLGPYSPAVNTGNDAAIGLPDTDLSGSNRKFGSAVDMGAYERQAAPSGVVQILSLPVSQTTCVGLDVSFQCDAGTNVVIWQQFIGGNYSPVFTGTTYQLSNVSTSDSAQLRIAIANSGYTSSPFFLTVNPPGIIYVNINGPVSGNGTSWTNAMRSLRDAITMADACSEIWVAKGDYVITNAFGQPVPVSMKSNLPIYGGFAGTETMLSQRQWWTNVTRILADSETVLIANVGFSSPIDESALLDGFTISGGPSFGTIYNAQASPTFRNCTFMNARPAIWNSAMSRPMFDNCVFTNNPGGGFYGFGGSPTFSNCVFANNTATYGGGVYNSDGTPTVVDCTFRNNHASYGGGVEIDFSTNAIVLRCIFEGNSARDGGGLSAYASTITVMDSLFVGNSADNRGGASSQYKSHLNFINCTITDNESADRGGGIDYLYDNSLTVVNSIIWNNRDADIFTSIEDAQINAQSGSVQQISFSTIQGLSRFTGNNNIAFDPLFNANAFTLDRIHSPAINAGNIAGVSNVVDLAGSNRISGATVDHGAYEVQNPVNLQPAYFTETPKSVANCEGELVTFTVRYPTSSVTNIVWQLNSGSGFGAIPNDGNHSSAHASDWSTLVVSNLNMTMDGITYRFIAYDSGYTSAPLALTVSPPEVIYVNASAVGTQTGESWANAYRTLEPAFARGDSCSEIWIASGVYTSSALRMKRGLEIFGGFNGTEDFRSERDVVANEVVIMANPGAAIINNYGSNPIDRSAVLDGVTLVGAAGSVGIENLGASPTIRNVTFRNHTFWAVNNNSSAPLYQNCTFANNSNTPIRNLVSDVVISNCVFENNRSQFSAGMENNQSTVLVIDSEFRGNQSQYSGGAINNGNSTTLVMNCLFENNSVGMDGGAIANGYVAKVRIVNSVFNGNYARRGGAIASWGNLESINNTVIRNQAEISSSGLYQGDGVGEIHNTIFWQNFDTISLQNFPTVEKAQLFREAGSWSVTYCDIQGLNTLAGNGNTSFDPLMSNPETGGYELTSHSPVINAGNNSFVTNVLYDRSGLARVQFGTVDIGAHEATSVGSPVNLLQTPVGQSVCEGSTVSFTVTATNNIGGDFEWEYDIGGGWIPYPGAINVTGGSSTLTIESTIASMDGYQYRFILPGVVTGAPAILRVAAAEIIFVNASAPSGGTGLSWLSPYNDLQTALAAVQDCRKILWVANGTYRPTTGSNASISFSIPPNAIVYGGFSGNENSLNQRNITANRTILSGDIGVQGATNDNSFYVVLFDGGSTAIDASTKLDGVYVEGGRSAGIEVSLANPVIENCIIQSNRGSGLFVFNGAPVIRQSKFLNNYSSSGGGGAKVQSDFAGTGTTIFQDCEITGNRSTFGAGVEVIGGQALLANCLIRDNVATANGGGVATVNGVSTATVVNCTIYNNTAFRGGGIGNAGGQVVVRNSILWNNVATVGNASIEQSQIFFQTSPYDIEFSCIAGISNLTGNGNTGSGPMFVDEDSDDFRLQACSALIDAGNNADVIGDNDLGGDTRISNGTVDIGAFEYQGAPSTSFDIVGQPQTFTYCAIATNTFTVIASGGGLSYQWQADYGSGFANIANDSVHSGADTDTLTIQSPPISFNGAKYRCVVTDGGLCSSRSASAILFVNASRVYVNATVTTSGNGLSWTGAYKTVQEALASPALDPCGSEIWVAEGEYTPAGTLHIPSYISIYGGFAGDETDVGQRDWIVHDTIINGDGISSVMNYDGLSISIAADTILDGITIDGGNSAGVFLHRASPLIRNSTFKNIAGSGIVINNESSPLIDHCRFLANTSTNGGGIHLVSGEPTIQNCSFQGNTAASSGGGFFAQDGSPTFINCLFTGNRSYSDAGAVGIVSPGTTTVINCTIVGNKSAVKGAGLSVNCNRLTMANSIIWNNDANGQSDEEGQMWVLLTDDISISNSCIQNLSFFTGNGNVANDPVFLDYITADQAPTTDGDFRLQTCSPLIDAGDDNAVSGVTNDLDGMARIFGGAVDIGAYEVQVNANTPLMITSQPASLSFCPVRNADHFTVAATGSGLVYQWQVNTGMGFVPVTNLLKYSGMTTSSLLILSANNEDDGTQYRCLINSSEGCFLYTRVVTLTFNAERYYVKFDATGSGDGSSWSNAFTSLQQALSTLAANEEDRRVEWTLSGIPAYNDWKAIYGPCNSEVWVVQGTNVGSNMGMAESVTIYGGFAGTETNLSQRDWVANPTVLKANGANHIFYNQLRGSGGTYTRMGPDSVLDGFILEGATHSAVYNNQEVAPTFANSLFRNNNRGIYNIYSDPTIRDCVFEGNGSPTFNPAADGAAIYHQTGTMRIENSIIRSNTANFGAGIWNEFGTAIVFNCVFSGNYANDYGGGYIGADAEIRNSTFTGNRAGNQGAGIYAYSADRMFVYNSIVWSNFGNGYAEINQIRLPGNPYNVYNSSIQNMTSPEFDGKGNVSINPLFVVPLSPDAAPSGTGDFHLDPCSGLIDLGSNAWVMTVTDLDGNQRISGQAVDLGAYERQVGQLITQQPANQGGSVVDAALFTVLSSVTNATFQWQESTDGGQTFNDLSDGGNYSGVTSNVLSVSGTSIGMTGYRYRAKVYDGCDLNISESAAFHYVNARPVAVSQLITIQENESTPILIEGYDPEGELITFTSVVYNGPGQLQFQSEFNNFRSYNYFMGGNVNGTNVITFVVNDGQTNSLPGTITIVATPVNSMNFANNNQHIYGFEDVPLNFVFDASDADNDPLTVNVWWPLENGIFTYSNHNGLVYGTYYPNTNWSGDDRLGYFVSDGEFDAYGNVYIHIAAVDDPPVANPDFATLYQGLSVSIPVLANDYDVEGGISLLGFSQGSHGSVVSNGTNLVYTHNGSPTTSDQFNYQIRDQSNNVVFGSVFLTIKTNLQYLVTTNIDHGPGSLREAMNEANLFGGTNLFPITFSPSLSGKTILLTNIGDTAFGESAFAVEGHISIDAASAPLLTISRADTSTMRFFRVSTSGVFTLKNINVQNGFALGQNGFNGPRGYGGGAGGFGGAIYSEGQIHLTKVNFDGNVARGGDGGVFAFPGDAHGGGVNGGLAPGGHGGFGGGGAGSGQMDANGPGGLGGFGAGQGGGLAGPGLPGGNGGFGGGGGGGPSPGMTFGGGGGMGAGGAIFNRAGMVFMTNCTFIGNSSTGGLGSIGGPPTYSGTNGSGYGGAFFNYNGTADIINCSFITNNAKSGHGVFNIGDGANAFVTMRQITMTNAPGATNMVQVQINGGSAGALHDNLFKFVPQQPAMAAIQNVTSIGPVDVPFEVLLQTSVVDSVNASSIHTALISQVSVSGSGVNRVLEITPVLGATGTAQIVVNIAGGDLTMSQTLNYTPTKTLNASVVFGHAVVIPILSTNSGWSVSGANQGVRGTVTFSPGAITYMHNQVAGASDSFAFTFTDGLGTATGTVNLTILPNSVPVAQGMLVYVLPGRDESFVLQGTDADGDVLSFQLDSLPQHGTLYGVPPNLVYAPNPGYSGTDSFAFRVSDGISLSAPAVVNISVRDITLTTVTSSSDAGPGSLRDVLDGSNADPSSIWHITFDPEVATQVFDVVTIGNMDMGPSAFVISNFVVIDGEANTIQFVRDGGAPEMRFFRVASNALLSLKNVKLSGGIARGQSGESQVTGGGGGAGLGGAIFNEGILLVEHATLVKNQALGGEAGVYDFNSPDPDYLRPGGKGGDPNGGAGAAPEGSGQDGGYGGGGGGTGSSISGAKGGAGGFGGGNGGNFNIGAYDITAGNGGFGGGGGGGWPYGGGGGLGAGGAIFNNGGEVTIQSSEFHTNTVAGGESYPFDWYGQGERGEGYGGSIFTHNGRVDITDTRFIRSITPSGGAVYVLGDGATGRVTFTQVTFNSTEDLWDVIADGINGGRGDTLQDYDSYFWTYDPFIDHIADQTMIVATSHIATTFFVAIPFLNPGSYAFSATSDNQDLVPDSNLVITTPNNDFRTLTITPVTNIFDSAIITVTMANDKISYGRWFTFVVGLYAEGERQTTNTVIQFQAPAGYTYTVQRSALLTNPAWTNIGTATSLNNGRFRYLDIDVLPGETYFYRLLAVP